MTRANINDDQRRRIRRAVERENVNDLTPIRQLSSAEELHQFILHYNWDDGNQAILEVLRHQGQR
jgi:hypothetical protein